MEDFHLKSLHSPITPLVLILEPFNTSYLLVRSGEEQLQQAIAALGEVTQSINPDYPLDYHFLDLEYEQLYHMEQMIGRLVLVIGLIAIFIRIRPLYKMSDSLLSRTKWEMITKI
jgi:putative ABC transport system permease protein